MLLGGTKSSPALAATSPENPAERISFRFASRAFAVVFHGREEQKPEVGCWLLPRFPLSPRRLWDDVGGRKLNRAVQVSHCGVTEGEDGGDKQDLWVDFFFLFLFFIFCSHQVLLLERDWWRGASTGGVAELSPMVGFKWAFSHHRQHGSRGERDVVACLPAGPSAPAAPVPCGINLSQSHQSCLLQFQILPPQLINGPGADSSLTIVFCN